jgi:teichoic acid transport system permease protein
LTSSTSVGDQPETGPAPGNFRPDLPVPTGTPQGLASEFGLQLIGLRPPFLLYLRRIWHRRYFIIELSRAREQSANAESRLGQIWQVLNPLLNAAVYFLIFGVLLNTRSNIHDYIAWLVIGIFLFGYTQSAMLNGARSVSGNLGIVRALHFPRAMLPISVVVEELFTLGTAMIICAIIVVLTGAGISVWWLVLIPSVALQTMFAVGLALTFARITERVRDVAQLLPFLARTWLYLSGVVFSLQNFAHQHAPWVKVVLFTNPGAVYVELGRGALLHSSNPIEWYTWVAAVAWAIIGMAFGFVYFWRAEARYGRG